MRRFIPDRILSLIERTVGAKLTYAQYGEDLIVDRALRNLGIERPTYLDVGAYSASLLSNTALFYRRGLSGVCVDADPELCAAFRRRRPRDICINAGVGGTSSVAEPFYVMSVRALSTFSAAAAERLVGSGEYSIERIVPVPVVTLAALIERYCRAAPNFLSVDIEGDELAALETLDFEACRPEVVCAETLTFSDDPADEVRLAGISELMLSNDYLVFADTRVNTIFVDGRKMHSRAT